MLQVINFGIKVLVYDIKSRLIFMKYLFHRWQLICSNYHNNNSVFSSWNMTYQIRLSQGKYWMSNPTSATRVAGKLQEHMASPLFSVEFQSLGFLFMFCVVLFVFCSFSFFFFIFCHGIVSFLFYLWVWISHCCFSTLFYKELSYNTMRGTVLNYGKTYRTSA